VVIWFIFPRFGILEREKSGNPDLNWGPIAWGQGPFPQVTGTIAQCGGPKEEEAMLLAYNL
jgi:hypothetical protein